jgi:hypothetical protein
MKAQRFVGVGLLLGALLSFGARSAQAADCTSKSCSGPLKLIYASPTEDTVYVQPDGSLGALTCSNDGKYLSMKVDTDTKRATWQLLLAAMLSGKSVLLRVNTDASLCTIQYVTMAP